MRLLIAFCCGALLMSLSCGGDESADQRQTGESVEQMTSSIDSVLAAHTDHLMGLPDVVGVGVGECAGKPCIKVFAAKESPALREQVPDSIEGFKVEISVTGEFKTGD